MYNNIVYISTYVTRKRASIRFLRRRDRNSVDARCDRINKSLSFNRYSAHRYIRRCRSCAISYAPAELTKRKRNALCMRFNRTCCNVFSGTFSREEIAFFYFHEYLIIISMPGWILLFQFLSLLCALTHDLFPEKIISVDSIVYIIHIICIYIVSSHRV